MLSFVRLRLMLMHIPMHVHTRCFRDAVQYLFPILILKIRIMLQQMFNAKIDLPPFVAP
jgi:hypothetical protein